MSFRTEKFMRFQGTDVPMQIHRLDNLQPEDLRTGFLEILKRGLHGLCFSVYEAGQKPGDPITAEQIQRKIGILKPYARWVRSFSCTQGNELIPRIAKEAGMKTLVGAWLGEDAEKNGEELEGLYRLADDGCVDIAAVGNEVLYRDDLSEDTLLRHIAAAKARMPSVPVGYVDAYYEFVDRPAVAEGCDIILCNCYPYWEGTPYEHAFDHMRHMYQLAVEAARGKRVLITETGWPSRGETLGGAEPSALNAMKYFMKAQLWAQENSLEMYYFSSFDEPWKIGAEGEVGAYWGIWDSREELKF
ncbi:MAG: hypothetical protein JJU00_09050 [Opitutales bacterium]|nr:hypothetical protein [Opitutales bacterium]